MRTRSAVEIARASLALAFPTATEEGLDRAAQLVVRWGSQGVGERLTAQLRELMLEDLEIITQSAQPLARVEEPRARRADPQERVWRTTEATRRRPPDPGGPARPV
ncbi:hypothetical protein [Actinacidiphila bryophytorum]|jgi:hypothetical protein|uniref:hypothetical protein n=1 Tax=Actinacidiphila bryophytorum TaxID=1436133 RepID=UPI002176DE8D|nr:hypothetical protein [Actinacidiphila bryophytorum]UWE08593.1 hypothetical protein NYE86_07575 [Actinacidiphila bryophytorum]